LIISKIKKNNDDIIVGCAVVEIDTIPMSSQTTEKRHYHL